MVRRTIYGCPDRCILTLRCAQVESWAFSVDTATLALLVEKGIFWRRSCKLCGDSGGIVIGSEYGMSTIILDAGFNIGTLMSR